MGQSVKSGVGRGPPPDEERPLLPEHAQNPPVSLRPACHLANFAVTSPYHYWCPQEACLQYSWQMDAVWINGETCPMYLSRICQASMGIGHQSGALPVQEMRQRLSTLDEGDEEEPEDCNLGGRRSQSSDEQQANQCAAELLRTSSLIALGALDAGTVPAPGFCSCEYIPAPAFSVSGVLRVQGYLMAKHRVSMRSAARWTELWRVGLTILMHHASHNLLQAILRCLDEDTPPLSTEAAILTKQHMIDDWLTAGASKTYMVL